MTKKKGKIRVCLDLKKVNATIVRDHYPLLFTEHVLERMAGHEAYSFLVGFSGYNKCTLILRTSRYGCLSDCGKWSSGAVDKD